MPTDRMIETENIVVTLHFAVTMLWVEKFQESDNPAEAARAYAENIGSIFRGAQAPDPSQQQYFDDLLLSVTSFFDHVVSEVLSRSAHSDS